MHLKCATTYRPSSLGKGFPRRIDLPPRILQNGLLSGVPATWLEIYAFNNALYSRTSDVRVPGSGALWGVPRWHCLPQRPHSHHPHHHHHHNRLWGPWTLLCANMVVNMMSFVGQDKDKDAGQVKLKATISAYVTSVPIYIHICVLTCSCRALFD